MNPEKNINENEQIEREEQAINETKIWNGVSHPPQNLLNNWYNHTSNKEKAIADWERQREEETNLFND